jgi:uncharacterized phage protein gp47/JayE
MPFLRPTLPTIRDGVVQDIVAAKPGSRVIVPYSNLAIFSNVVSDLANAHYGYLDYIALQSVPWTATDEALAGWGALKGITRKPSVEATGTITLTGVANALVPAGTSVRRSDGLLYATASDVTIDSSGTASTSIYCLTDGATGNLPAGSVMSLASGVSGVLSNVTAGAITGGADIEDDTDYRGRVLLAYSAPASGGDAQDYRSWCLAVPGVTRAWVNPLGAGAGSVVCYVMLDDAEASNNGFPIGVGGGASDETRITPATGDLLAVADYVYPLRPVTALVYVYAPIPYPVNFTIQGAANTNALTRANIAAALSQVFLAEADPLNGDIQPSSLELAIGSVISNFALLSPTNVISGPLGYLPCLGTVTYT